MKPSKGPWKPETPNAPESHHLFDSRAPLAVNLAEPFGLLDLADLVAFITAFSAQDPAADFVEPFGVFDLDDIVAFITAFEAGCP